MARPVSHAPTRPTAVPTARSRSARLDELTPHLVGTSTQRNPQRDLATPMSDRVAEDAVGPDRREQQGDEGVKDREERGRSSGDQARVDTGFHRLDVVDRQLGIDRSHDALQGAAERVWFERRSRHHEESVVEPLGIGVGTRRQARPVQQARPVSQHRQRPPPYRPGRQGLPPTRRTAAVRSRCPSASNGGRNRRPPRRRARPVGHRR